MWPHESNIRKDPPKFKYFMNKRFFWSLLTFAMVAMLSVGLVSCGDDDKDDNGGGATTQLSGLWRMYYYYEIEYLKNSSGQWVKSDEYEETFKDDEVSDGILFMNGGKVMPVWVNPDGTYEEDGDAIDYVIKDGHIYTKYAGPDMWLDAGAIKINGNLMEISGVDYEDDNFKAEWVEKYKKIK